MQTQQERLQRIAELLAGQAKGAGVRSVIVAVSEDTPEGHSVFYVASQGPCLELEGLARRIRRVVVRLWKGKAD